MYSSTISLLMRLGHLRKLSICARPTQTRSLVTSAVLPHASFLNRCKTWSHRWQIMRNCATKSDGEIDPTEQDSDDEVEDEPFDFTTIAKGDVEVEKRLKILALEMEVMRQEGALVPNVMKQSHWEELLLARSKSKRMSYLTFLFKIERKDEHAKEKKEKNKQLRLEWLAQEAAANPGHIQYGFSGNTIFMRVYETTMDKQLNNKLVQAMQFSQDIVIDCGFENFMTRLEVSNCVKQLSLVFAQNRLHIEPFNLQFVNFNTSGRMYELWKNHYPTLVEGYFPMNVTDKSYLEMYPKEKLVYLTPHCKQELLEYSHDDVYIIGGIVDKGECQPFSMAKAKKQGLRMARLPLERHLLWGLGNKSLTLTAMINIMLDMRRHNDWDTAFQHVPKRKLLREDELTNNPNFARKEMLLAKQEEKLQAKRERKQIIRNSDFYYGRKTNNYLGNKPGYSKTGEKKYSNYSLTRYGMPKNSENRQYGDNRDNQNRSPNSVKEFKVKSLFDE